MARENDFVEFRSPLAGLTPDERSKAIDTIGQNARKTYEETKAKLIELLTEVDQVQILACMGWRFFAAQAAEGGGGRSPAAHQHHLEILHALSLRYPRADTPQGLRLADIVQQVIDLLDANTRAFNWSRFSGSTMSDERANRLLHIQEQIRGDTQFVRGEFHPHQLDQYLRSILHKVDAEFLRVFGVTGTSVLSLLQNLLNIIEEKLNSHRLRVGRVIRIRKPNKAIKAYFSEFPEEEPRRSSIIADSVAKRVTPEMMRYFLMEEADRFLPEALSFHTSEIAKASPDGSDLTKMKAIIDAWSFAFADLKDIPVEYLYMANPAWNCPFIKLTDDQYFWPCPASSMSFGFEMFEKLMAMDAKLLWAYEDARAAALEEELEALLTRYFPAGRVLRGLRWLDSTDGKRYENDAIVVIDRFALLFEAKSGKVSGAARRGASLSLIKEVGKLMVEPAQQSMRLLELLSKHRQEHRFATMTGEEVIDSREIDIFVRVNVTFNSIGAISSRWPKLVEADIIKNASVQVPTMSIADFDTVCELLKEQSTITHYLHRRAPFERNADYLADEMDLLAFYLKTGFNVGETEYDGTHLMIYGMSDELNAYYKRRAEGRSRRPPSAQRTNLFNKLISALEERRPAHWLESAGRLLSVAFSDQKIIEKNIASSIAKVRQCREPSMSWAAELSNGPPQRKEAIAFVWYRCADRDSRNSRLRAHAKHAMDMAGKNDCLVVGFDVTRSAEPYSVIGVFKRPVVSS